MPKISKHSLKVLTALHRVQPANNQTLARETDPDCMDSKKLCAVVARNGLALKALYRLGYITVSVEPSVNMVGTVLKWTYMEIWTVRPAGRSYLARVAEKNARYPLTCGAGSKELE